MNLDDLQKIKFQQPCSTPNGIGLIIGVSLEDGKITKVLISHKSSDLSNEPLEKINLRGGPCVNLFYNIEDIQEVADGHPHKKSQPAPIATQDKD